MVAPSITFGNLKHCQRNIVPGTRELLPNHVSAYLPTKKKSHMLDWLLAPVTKADASEVIKIVLHFYFPVCSWLLSDI